jgi:hypothetical protein
VRTTSQNIRSLKAAYLLFYLRSRMIADRLNIPTEYRVTRPYVWAACGWNWIRISFRE